MSALEERKRILEKILQEISKVPSTRYVKKIESLVCKLINHSPKTAKVNLINIRGIPCYITNRIDPMIN